MANILPLNLNPSAMAGPGVIRQFPEVGPNGLATAFGYRWGERSNANSYRTSERTAKPASPVP